MPDPNQKPVSPVELLSATAREFYRRGWARGGSGNYSVLLARKPMRLCITAAGEEIASLDDTNFLEIDDDAEIIQGFGRPSDETIIHLAIYRHRPRARCILYTQTVPGLVLADRSFVDGVIVLKDYEALKGIEGDASGVERIPIVKNSADQVALSHVIANVLLDNPTANAVLIRRHGLYVWGETIEQARRHAEIFEFMFELTERSKGNK
ncbi:MAG: L-ribulose-5-phosphate 4-epimerase [Acidobacteria bacterium OLB17]|nr:MAG: L-ribulose-5-phosphate 4-epimerase [Acidobacteria bacterium OLB17]MCZ2391125.1 methylthioribulose 1-phosphate dehydratase [Acidobacteriota bacterium]